MNYYYIDCMSNTMINLSKILVAIDGSQTSMDAADYAIEIAKEKISVN